MKLFLDTGFSEEVKSVREWCSIDGVTTNPSLIAKSGKSFRQAVGDICEVLPDGDISAEIISMEYSQMLEEALSISDISKNIVIKIPVSEQGLRLTEELSRRGIRTNLTLVFSLPQVLLCAKAGATYISVFMGRIDDIAFDNAVNILSNAVSVVEKYHYSSEILAASIRHPVHLVQTMQEGVHAVTVPYSVLKGLYKHPLTSSGIDRFMLDWEAAGLDLQK